MRSRSKREQAPPQFRQWLIILGSLAALVAMWVTPAVAQDVTGLARNDEVNLAYRVQGPAEGPPIILINGQGVAVRPEGDGLALALRAEGFRVIRFDNRDAGRSTLVTGSLAVYDLSDMADDAIAVLDAAGIERAHVMGHSLGGMVAQVLAAKHPARVLSLISVSSTTGESGLPYGPAMAAMSGPPENPSSPMADQLAHFYRIFDGSAYRMTDSEVAARVAADMAVEDPGAAERQAAAVAATGDRRDLLRTIGAPALVLHGGSDPWFPLLHAEKTADALRGARLEVIDGMGHIVSDAAAAIAAAHIARFVKALPVKSAPRRNSHQRDARVVGGVGDTR